MFTSADLFSTVGQCIAPSILSADFAKLGSEIDEVLRGGGELLHLDIMDGHFVPNISFGPPIIESIRPITSAFFDAHLMISEPLRYAPAIVKAGANNITFHVEAVDDPAHIAREIKKLGCRVGITLRPATPLEAILPAIELVDVVLIMSVVPGFSGQKFMAEVLPKARDARKRLRPDQRLEMDGGIHNETIAMARDAGVDWFVVASAIFDAPDRGGAIAELRRRLFHKDNMTRVVLIEAWPTPWDAEDRLVGSQSLPLAPSATAVIGAALARLEHPIDAVYRCASNEATDQAAKIVAAKFSLRPRDSDDLDELHLGLWQGLPRSEAKFRFPSAFEPWLENAVAVKPPDGEMLQDAVARLRGALKKILRRNRGKTVALALRPMSLQIVLGLLRDEDVSTIAKHLQNHEGIATIEAGEKNEKPEPSS